MSVREDTELKFNKSRGNLLLVAGLSLLNIVLVVFDMDLTFLFSATFPLLAFSLGQSLAEEYGPIFYYGGVGVAFTAILLYGLCYLLSKRRRVFLLVALVLFCLDTVFLVWLLSFGMDKSVFIDIAFHVWVLFTLGSGVKAWFALKKLPAEEQNPPDEIAGPALLSSDAANMMTADDTFTVTQPKTTVVIGVVCAVFFTVALIMATLSMHGNPGWFVAAVFGGFALLGVYLIVHGLKWKIRVEYNTFFVTPVFTAPKTAAFAEITKVKKGLQNISVYTAGGKLFTVERNCIGYDMLVKRLEKTNLSF